MVIFILVLLVNLLISWLNARSCGFTWDSSKREGGWSRVVVWSAAIQSGIGFTLAYYVLVMIVAKLPGQPEHRQRYRGGLEHYGPDQQYREPWSGILQGSG